MVATLLGSHTLPPGLLQFIQEKAGGNPLFIEEVTQALIERGLVVRADGGFTWTSAAEVAFPDTIQDIMRARIDRLQEPVKRTVQTAAVIGREFGLRLLTRISERAAEIQHDLGTLKQAELIHETHLFPELAYRFKHAVIQDVAYESLLVQRRQALHGAIGQAIEALYADHLEEQAAILAYHYARSVHQDRAVAYALLTGDRATRLYARTEAMTYYEQALTMAQALVPSPEAQRAQIDAILKHAAVGMTRQELERDQQNLEQAHALAEALADEGRLAQVFYWQGRIPYARGDYRAAIASAEQSLAVADRLDDEALAAPPVNLLGRISWLLSDYVQASQLLARSTEQMRRLGNTTEEATAAAFAGVAFGFVGQFDQALTYADYGLRLAQELRNPFTEAATYHYRAHIHDQRGAWAQVITDCEEARRIAERAGDLFRVYVVKFFEGRAHTMAGNAGRGRVLLEESIALSAQLGTTFLLAWAKAYLAGCLLALGERDTVPPLCHEAIHLAEERGEKFANALAHRTLAEALFALVPTDPPDVERSMLEAIRIQQEISNKPELARSYMSYARLLQGWGEEAKASEYLTWAISMFQQMGMTWDLIKAEQVLQASR
jgi:tetratricopeptide (TPR) repeat protein